MRLQPGNARIAVQFSSVQWEVYALPELVGKSAVRLGSDWRAFWQFTGASRARHASFFTLHFAACSLRYCPSSLGYVEGNTVQLKGRVACEINTCDELIATEMVFENVLESLDPPEIAGWS